MDTYTIQIKKAPNGRWNLFLDGPSISTCIQALKDENIARRIRNYISYVRQDSDEFHVRYYRLYVAGASENLILGSEEIIYGIGRERLDKDFVITEAQDGKIFLLHETVEEENV
jgi:hypothetical protein